MNVDMILHVKFNRPVSDRDCIVPGGYEMIMNGKTVCFDFHKANFSVASWDSTIGVFCLSEPDYAEFPDFRNVTCEDFARVTKIEDCYIFLGEPGESDLEVVSIEHIAFDVYPEMKPPTFVVSRDVLDDYNKRLQGGEGDTSLKKLLVVEHPDTKMYGGFIRRDGKWTPVFQAPPTELFFSIRAYTNMGYALTSCLSGTQAGLFLRDHKYI